MTRSARHEPPRLAPLAEPVPEEPQSEERFDRVVRLARQLFGVPMVAVNLVNSTTLTTIAAVGLPLTQYPRAGTVCDHTVNEGAQLVIPDMTTDPRFAGSPYVTGVPRVRFYGGEPLRSPSGEVVGTLCIYDRAPRDVDALETRMLRDLADWVERELANDVDNEQAREVQRRLVPRHEIIVPGYDISGQSVPARNVGGDYFDWQVLDDDIIQVVVADVMGKGITAAVIAAGVRAVMRGSSRYNSLADSVARTSSSMEADLDDTGSFVTMFTARLTPATGDLQYVDAGHGLAIIIEASGNVRRLVSRDLPLGSVTGSTFQVHQENLAPGDTLLVVSDGILDLFPDARSAVKAGVELSSVVSDAREMTARIAGIGAGKALDDDITAVVIRRRAS
ncbi:MAG: SpoIIE family protein phosphatase [Sporichthyaceae bacterium]|nr:SpoIIE family protein phosphatase [Sporichthyaceae bacterium]